MPASPRHQLADLLRDVSTGGSFSTRRTTPPDNLTIDVKGVGTIRLPVTAGQAKQLRMVARPARYGKGEETILDRAVRDTWEVPRSRMAIDKPLWANTLRPMLDTVRNDLGLPATCALKAELHSMLVYEPGQFFAAHQDSEKDDRMIGTLIVLLPSRSDGGECVVEHLGRSVTYNGSPSSLTFIAFYADTKHEVRPLTNGHRVALTYNLMLAGSSTPGHANTPALNETAAGLLTQHFHQRPEPRWRDDSASLEPPDRLVFLLDHQYSEHSLQWTQLKGEDAIRGDTIRRAAQLADCETALALVEIHETWDCSEPAPRYRGGRWSDDETEDDELDDDDYELGDLIDSTVEITSVNENGRKLAPDVTDAELAASTHTASLPPYDTEYTGNMGNWGNTMDRWYRRAAVVVWPTARSFALRAKADPLGASEELLAALADTSDNQHIGNEMALTLLRFWPEGVRSHGQRTLLQPALRLAAELDEPNIAAQLLGPFEINALTPTDAPALLILDNHYGRKWLGDRITTWTQVRRPVEYDPATSRLAWIQALPDLCRAIVRDANPANPKTTQVAQLIVSHTWTWLHTAIDASTTITKPSARRTRMYELAPAVLALLHATSISEDPALSKKIVSALCDPEFRLIPLLLRVIDSSATMTIDELKPLGIVTLARHSATSLEAELARPERSPQDWSITGFTSGDSCKDCVELAAFLNDPTRQKVVWPLAKPRRQHIHQRIEDAELPVTHRTTREGSPHKLVITKTADLFTHNAVQRTNVQTALASIERLLGSRRPTKPRTR